MTLDVLVTFGGYGQGISGAQRMAQRSVEQLRARGNTVVTLTDAAPADPAHRQASLTFASWDELSRHLPGWRPDVVHAFDLAKPDLVDLAWQLARRFAAPFALTPCSAPEVWPDPAGGAAACRAADVLFGLTEVETRQLRQTVGTADRIRRVPHASDLVGQADPVGFRRKHGLTGPAVVFVGRRVAFKGYQVLVRAMPAVWRQVPDATLLVAGPDADGAVPVADPGADGRIRDLGVADEQTKHDAIAASTVLCLPTSIDVFPLVFIEAWLCGKPVVSGAFEGAHGVVRHGLDGLIVRPEPDEVAAALTTLLTDPALCAAMGRAGRQRAVLEHSWQRVAVEYEAGYAWAIGAKT